MPPLPPPGPMRPNPTMPERRPRGRRAEVKRLREENERLTRLVIATQERLLWALDKAAHIDGQAGDSGVNSSQNEGTT